MLNNDDLKSEIENRIGLPKELLSGETPEETIARARAIIAFKKKEDEERPRDNREQFKEWFNDVTGNTPASIWDTMSEQLNELEKATHLYPEVHDGGNPYINGKTLPDPRNTREIFSEWFGEVAAFDPRKDENGWIEYPY